MTWKFLHTIAAPFVVEDEKKLNEIVEYCKPHVDQMWAAYIVSIIYKCDFRDVPKILKEREEL